MRILPCIDRLDVGKIKWFKVYLKNQGQETGAQGALPFSKKRENKGFAIFFGNCHCPL
jgi:hypothetical protein